MFSPQTIFGSGQLFYTLLDEATRAAYASSKALHGMMQTANGQPTLDAFRLARQRERTGSDKISHALVDSFITTCERDDIEALGHKLVKLQSIHGFAAEAAPAANLVTAAHFGMPVSTTHRISTAIMGVGFANNPRKLNVGVIERIVWEWILTIPAAGGMAYLPWRLLDMMGWSQDTAVNCKISVRHAHGRV